MRRDIEIKVGQKWIIKGIRMNNVLIPAMISVRLWRFFSKFL